jgi:hypothetical protein
MFHGRNTVSYRSDALHFFVHIYRLDFDVIYCLSAVHVDHIVSTLADSNWHATQNFPFYIRTTKVLQFIVFSKTKKWYHAMNDAGLVDDSIAFDTIWMLMYFMHNIQLSVKEFLYLFNIKCKHIETACEPFIFLFYFRIISRNKSISWTVLDDQAMRLHTLDGIFIGPNRSDVHVPKLLVPTPQDAAIIIPPVQTLRSANVDGPPPATAVSKKATVRAKKSNKAPAAPSVPVSPALALARGSSAPNDSPQYLKRVRQDRRNDNAKRLRAEKKTSAQASGHIALSRSRSRSLIIAAQAPPSVRRGAQPHLHLSSVTPQVPPHLRGCVSAGARCLR